LGIGDWAQSPKPKTPNPKPKTPIYIKKLIFKIIKNNKKK
jgi:hypothetical protein